MLEGDQQERQVRAARNQAMFRAINEKLTELNEAFEAISDTQVIACECADTGCIETLEISADEYEAIRKEPNRFAVLARHVYPDVESVVEETDRYVVVDKFGAAEPVAEALDPRSD
jgi:5-bromo-4-chloroindolyl phosphate hydrolysis protein